MRARPILPLQIAIALAGLVPVGAGGAGVFLGTAMLGHSLGAVSLDSHFRYLSGLLLAIGLLFWSFIPTITTRRREVRLLTIVVVTGGLARALGAALWHDPVTAVTWFALGMELVVTPLLCWWQSRVARTN